MGRDAAELLRDALALPAEVRAELIDSLIESLDQTRDEGAEQAWWDEIRRRIEEVDNGSTRLTPWEDARRLLRARLAR